MALTDERIAELRGEACKIAPLHRSAATPFARSVEAEVRRQDEPLTEAQVQALIEAKHFRSGYELKASDQVCLEWYRLGLRDGERAHGIKGGGQHGTE